ncbi:MAG: complex I subunit 4 family protein [Geodermatophilaceae bacterium]
MIVLSLVVFLPLVAALVMLVWPKGPSRAVTWVWIGASVADLALVVALWISYDGGPGVTEGIAFEERLRWIPGVGSSYHIGVDGLSLPLVALTAVLFLACAVHALGEDRNRRTYAALFLFLQTVCTGLFVSLDLILFFVFFDLSIVGMYFVIAGWGHGAAARAALKFFLYTFLGSLALLLGFIGLYVASDPHTFDMVELARSTPLDDQPVFGGLVLLAIGVGLAIKTPTFPFHTWLPPAHTEAPAGGSAILAGVLLKMGTFGFVRIAMPILPEAWRTWAWVIIAVGVVSVLWGALVALAQNSFKRLVAYTSVNHMGYVLLALGAAGVVGADETARSVAVTGAVTQMVSHGLITAALFLLTGVMWDRRGTYDMSEYGGVAGPAPRFAALLALAAFASLGLPGFSGFIAEFQIFAGSLGSAPVATAVALLGILITAGLFLWALQRILLGPTGPAGFSDLRVHEWVTVAALMVLAVVVGLFPAWLLAVIEPAARVVVELVGS